MYPRAVEAIYASDPNWVALSPATQQQLKAAITTIIRSAIYRQHEEESTLLECLLDLKKTGLLGLFDLPEARARELIDIVEIVLDDGKTNLNLSLLTIKALAQEAFLSIFSHAVESAPGTKFSFFMFQNTPEQIQAWGQQLKSRRQKRVDFCLDQLACWVIPIDHWPRRAQLTHTLTTEQFAALKEALSEVTAVGLSQDPSSPLPTLYPPELWYWLAKLFNRVTHLYLADERSFVFTMESLTAFGELICQASDLDLTSMCLYSESTEEARDISYTLARITQHCKTLHFKLFLREELLPFFFSAAHRSKLILSNLPLYNIKVLIRLFQTEYTFTINDDDIVSIDVIRATHVGLSNNQLHLLEDGEWQGLCQGARETKCLDLSGNKLALIPNYQRLSFIFQQLKRFEWVNLDNNDFDKDLDPAKWTAFCTALRESGIHCLAPLSNLSDEQQITFDEIMRANALRTSLKSAMKRFFLYRALPEYIPAIPKGLRDEVEPVFDATLSSHRL